MSSITPSKPISNLSPSDKENFCYSKPQSQPKAFPRPPLRSLHSSSTNGCGGPPPASWEQFKDDMDWTEARGGDNGESADERIWLTDRDGREEGFEVFDDWKVFNGDIEEDEKTTQSEDNDCDTPKKTAEYYREKAFKELEEAIRQWKREKMVRWDWELVDG